MLTFFDEWKHSVLYTFHDIIDTWKTKFTHTKPDAVMCTLSNMTLVSKYTTPTLYLLDAGLAAFYWEHDFWGHILQVSHEVVVEEGWEQQDLIIHLFHLIEDIQNHTPNLLPSIVFNVEMLKCVAYTHSEYVSPSLSSMLLQPFDFIWFSIDFIS